MKLRKFEEYLKTFSRDPKSFEKQVSFLGESPIEIFENFTSSSLEKPVVVWSETIGLNESLVKVKSMPSISKIYEKFSGDAFFPRETSSRADVKKLTFPIVGISESDEEEFKTYGKFKKSEKYFDKFREKPIPLTRFDVILHKDTPIHVQERINGLGFDADLRNFKYLTEVEDLSAKLAKAFDLDFYHLSLIESRGALFLENLGRSLKLSPSQSVKLYEAAYASHYESSLPGWFKKSLFETYVKPYYQKRYYDSLLIKPKNSIDFKKYTDLA